MLGRFVSKTFLESHHPAILSSCSFSSRLNLFEDISQFIVKKLAFTAEKHEFLRLQQRRDLVLVRSLQNLSAETTSCSCQNCSSVLKSKRRGHSLCSQKKERPVFIYKSIGVGVQRDAFNMEFHLFLERP